MNKHIWRLGLIVLICLLSHRASAQKTRGGDSPRRDTVFVYDTLFVTDTVWLPHPGKQHHRLLPTLPPLQPEGFALGSPSKTLIFFSGNTATLANSDIIDSVNIIHLKNTDTMKKIGFFGVVFLAFQHMVLSQNHVTLNSGLGVYRMLATPQMTSNPGADFSIGVGFRRDIVAGKLSAGGELNFHLMMRSDFDTLLHSGQYAGFRNPLTGDEDFSRKPLMINLPLFLRWQTPWLSPSIGADFYYKITPRKGIVVSNDGQILENARYRTPYAGVGLLFGLDAPISSRVSLGLTYVHGLTRERSADFNGTLFSTRMQRLELRARYRL